MAPEGKAGHESGKSMTPVTPRKIKPDAGLRKQTSVRSGIVKHMRHEMLICSLTDFIEKLCPFSPDPHWVDLAYDHLKARKLLGTPPKTTPQKQTSKGRKTKNSQQAGYEENAHLADYDDDTQDGNTVEWEAFRGMTPQTMTVSEMTAFKPLEDIVEALRDCPDPDEKRHANGYKYIDCPNKEMCSNILGGNFKVDAVIANRSIRVEEGKDNKGKNVGKDNKGKKVVKDDEEVVVIKDDEEEEVVGGNPTTGQTAVVMEFKKKATSQEKYENRRQLVSAANHIMNDDARRNWMYGITIENTEMSLWYFSRSYSMKSEPFDFTKDFKTFIRVFLSFLYADDEKLGHDPSIVRKRIKGGWCHIYQLETAEGPKFYKTLDTLYDPRSYCIAGRKSRVWKVVEVANSNNLTPIPGAPEVVLKDCWVDQGSLSEMEIQKQIFDSLKTVRESAYAWAPQGLKERIKDGLKFPERYFMKVVLDWKGEKNKQRPKSTPDPYLLSPSPEDSLANPAKASHSSRSIPPTAYPSPAASNSLHPPSEKSEGFIQHRDYKVKQHYRVVYADVGESLAKATSMSDAVTAFNDIFIALTLMFLARWVHRDVSEGNIILVRDGNGVRAKLSDLEYARDFDAKGGAASTDPKTGTPYFMPIEIHQGAPLRFKVLASKTAPNISRMQRGSILPRRPKPPPPSYKFIHDLESLWWIIVWIMLVRVQDAPWVYSHIFSVLEYPHPDRLEFFKMGDFLENHLQNLLNDTLCDRKVPTFLSIYNVSLCEFYESDERQEVYERVYYDVWEVMEAFIDNMSNCKMELEDPIRRTPLPASRLNHSNQHDLGKRMRSVNDDGSVSGMTAGDSLSKKKQKSGGDVFNDTEEEDEEAAVQDMTGIVREDSDPRINIRGAWTR